MGVCQWVYKKGDALAAIAISEKDGNTINIYDGRATNIPIHVLKLHTKPVTCISYNPVHQVSGGGWCVVCVCVCVCLCVCVD